PRFLSFISHHTPQQQPSFPTRRSSDLTHTYSTMYERWGNTFQPISNALGNPPRQIPSAKRPCRPSSGSMMAGVSCSSIMRSAARSEEHTSELQSRFDLVCRLLLEKKKT